MVVGEIGIPREQFLYQLQWWEIVSIRRGYERRITHQWETARFVAYCTIKSSMGGAPKIKALSDLLPLPGDRKEEDTEIPTDAEIERLQEQMRAYNEQNKE